MLKETLRELGKSLREKNKEGLYSVSEEQFTELIKREDPEAKAENSRIFDAVLSVFEELIDEVHNSKEELKELKKLLHNATYEDKMLLVESFGDLAAAVFESQLSYATDYEDLPDDYKMCPPASDWLFLKEAYGYAPFVKKVTAEKFKKAK